MSIRGAIAATALSFALCLALGPVAVAAYGSPGYGDPAGWCTNHSDMWTATVVTNDPSVPTNPEKDTFYGFHSDPGYDDWYGYFYGDFRGRAGDESGWVKLLHETYPNHYHWNFADSGWAVHGHVKQYIAYYNWFFGGECGMGWYGNDSPPPYMADQYGYPVVDIYVDAVPPFAPVPRVSDMGPDAVSFTWDPVTDRGDGAGQDIYTAGLDHYSSWLTLNGSSSQLQYADTPSPRTLKVTGMSRSDTACAHVEAFDALGNGTADQVLCAQALPPPPAPDWGPAQFEVRVAPAPIGLVGLESWFWLSPSPGQLAADETYRGVQYHLTASPSGASWNFGDGAVSSYPVPAGYGQPYPAPSTVVRAYDSHSAAGFPVTATVRYDVTWSALVSGRWMGPYPMGQAQQTAAPLNYPVEQAQPELLAT